MLDDGQKPKKRSLSEISHLFLSSVRDRQTDGANPPRRTPPKRTDVTIDLTPEEFAQVYGGGQSTTEARRKAVPVAAIIGAHLNGKQFDRVKQYARHRAAAGGRVGLIELDASELRLMCFDPMGHSQGLESEFPPECTELRQMTEAMEEMNWDVEQWIVLLPNPRTPEAKSILREVDHWILLSTCDHDGIVSSYRMLKALADSSRPRLTLSVLDAADDCQSGRVYQKLSSVCQQFLDWSLEPEPPVRSAEGVCEHLVLLYRPTRDKAQLANAPHFGVASQFLADAKAALHGSQPAEKVTQEDPEDEALAVDNAINAIADPIGPAQVQSTDPQASASGAGCFPAAAAATAPAAESDSSVLDVIELPGQDVSGQEILAAVLKKAGNRWIESPLRPPMCEAARIAVDRDRAMVLVVAAGQGLTGLRSISSAYRWLCENRQLIAMALPQFAIDARQTPRLHLLVDRADLTAEPMQAMLSAPHVTIQAYRKVRWGQRLGVFLEAA